MISADNATVEAWSVQPLPFEPKGWLLDLLEELRSGLAQIPRRAEGYLAARYVSSDLLPLCDADNILLSNVGTGHFRGLSPRGLVFERGDWNPPLSPQENRQFSHYVNYTIRSGLPSLSMWEWGEVIGSWPSVRLPSLTSGSNPAGIWWAIKQGGAHAGVREHLGRYGVRIRLLVLLGLFELGMVTRRRAVAEPAWTRAAQARTYTVPLPCLRTNPSLNETGALLSNMGTSNITAHKRFRLTLRGRILRIRAQLALSHAAIAAFAMLVTIGVA